MLDRINRTCTAGLRHSVRPANCKRSPLTGFEVPNVGHPLLFFFLFLFPHVSFHSHSLFLFQCSQPERLFQARKAASSCNSFTFRLRYLTITFLRLHSQPPALLQSLCLFIFLFPLPQCKARAKQKKLLATPQSGVCVWNTCLPRFQ